MDELVAKLQLLNRQWRDSEIEDDTYFYEVESITGQLKQYADLITDLTSQVDECREKHSNNEPWIAANTPEELRRLRETLARNG